MPWIVGGAAVIGSLIGSDGAKSAAKTQAASADAANATQKAMYDQTRQDNMPALDARNASLARMRELLGIGGNTGAQGYGSLAGPTRVANVAADPGYKFGMDQGLQALNSQLTARGMRNSGAALKAATRYGNDYASTKYGDAWNRVNSDNTNTFNRLASVGGLGQTGATLVGQAGTLTGQGIASNQMGAGNALAAGTIGSTNALVGAGNQLAGWYANRQPAGGSAWSAGNVNSFRSGDPYASRNYFGGMEGE